MVLASYPRVDRLLLPFPSFGVWCDRQTHRCRFGSVGHEEIQTSAWAQEEGTRLANRQKAALPDSIPSLGSSGDEYGWNDGSPVSREVHAGLCVQRRLACSAGGKPAGVRISSPVAWIAGRRETKVLKPIDRIFLGEIASHRAVTKVNARVAPKVSRLEGRARNLWAKAAWAAEC